METHQVAIVGAGPIGIELAVSLKKAGVDYLHFEAGQIGSTFEWWAPDTRFFSGPERIAIAGVPLVTPDQGKATREDYLAYLRSVVTQFDLDIRTYERVTSITPRDSGFEIQTRRSAHGVGGPAELARTSAPDPAPPANPNLYRARRIVLAIGDMQLPRLLGVPGENLPHVSHYFESPHKYFRKRVLIVGGKNSAVEAAIRCWRAGAHVTLSYRGDTLDEKRIKYWLLPELQWLIKTNSIRWLPGTCVQSIDPQAVTLSAGDTETTVEADFALLLTGYCQDQTLFDQLGIKTIGEGKKPVVNSHTMETSVPGIHVAGTAAAGTQIGGVRLFIENSHEHAERILAHITGATTAGSDPARFESLPES